MRAVVFLFILSVYSLYGSILITDSAKKYTSFEIGYLYDDTDQMDIDSVAITDFTQTIPSQFTLGYRDGTSWFKITLVNQSETSDFILSFTEPFWGEFDLYEPLKNGWQKHKNGLLTSLKKRDVEDANPAFILHLLPGESKTYYIRGKTVNGHIGAFELYTNDEFFKPSRFTLSTFYLFYSGVLFIIVILNFFLLIEMRERIYAYYIGYVSTYIVFISMFSGSYLYIGFTPWNHGLHTVGTIVLAFMALFSSSFLQLEKYFPRIDKVFKIFTITFFIMGILISLGFAHVTLVFNILASIVIFLLLILAIKTWQLKIIHTRYYLLALIIYMPSMGLMALTFDGLLQNTDFTRYTFLLGALIEIIFFSLILANRFHAIKDDKIRIQNELLEEKKKYELTLIHEIEKQSLEIQEKNALLIHQSRHAAMGEMISMLAHQWRQPLSAISATAGSLQINIAMDKYQPEQFNDQLNTISQLSQHLSKTINDFRDFFKENQEAAVFKPAHTLRHALKLNESLHTGEKITINSDLNDTVEIKSFENDLLQAILNILKNAFDALLENPIENRIITITLTEKSTDRVKIMIEDNAGGIPESIAERIFEPYFSTKSKNGAGLGLYMSKSIIEERCNGELSFHNTQNGSCFVIMLPK